jgi:hypothetical protein
MSSTRCRKLKRSNELSGRFTRSRSRTSRVRPFVSQMRMQLVGSAPDPQMRGLDELPGKVNYFRGNDSTHWRTNVRTYRRVKYTAVYPGVDLVYYGQPQQLEYDFIVAPGADPSTIKLAFAGVEHTAVDARGDLVLKTAGEPLRFQRPIIYQVEDGRRHTVEGGYVHASPREIGFQVGTYDRARPLIIDPVLSYSTYLGGSGNDQGNGIAVDATGAAYMTGYTSSIDFPTLNPLQPTHNAGFLDAFVAKLTPDGTALVYATYLGGSGQDNAHGIAVDSAGAAYVTGTTGSPDFSTVRCVQATKRALEDAFVAKLSTDGSELIYSTYLGGGGRDFGTAIAVDLTGAAYVTGTTQSSDFPTVNAFQPVVGNPGGNDGFVAKLTPDGTALAYSTYLGGSFSEDGAGIAVDATGAAYVTGDTFSADFPTMNPVQPYRGTQGSSDAFVAKLAPGGKSLIYSTHLGGSFGDDGAGIAVATGAVYVTGSTLSPDFPTVNALQPMFRLGDAFVVKLPPEGGSLMYATYLGGSARDSGSGIAVDTAGAAYVTGITRSPDFPTMNPLQPAYAGFSDAFVAKLGADGAALVYSTYLGGSLADNGLAIAVDLPGAAYVTGLTGSANFLTVDPCLPRVNPLQPAYGGGNSDAFVVKISGDSLAGPPANDSISGGESGSDSGGSENDGDSGGGSIDALLALLLAHFAFARARRRHIRCGE